MSLSKVIKEEEAAAMRWRAPSVGQEGGQKESESMLTAEQLEQLQTQAYQEGYDAGHQKGLAAGEAEIKKRVNHIQAVLDALETPLAQLDDQVEQELVTLALDIAKQIIRRELKTDPGQVVAVVREAVGILPLAQQQIRIHLNPEDAAVVRQALTPSEGDGNGWEIVEDPSLTRGGCKVSSETSQVDATLEKRLAAVSAAVLGGERELDNE